MLIFEVTHHQISFTELTLPLKPVVMVDSVVQHQMLEPQQDHKHQISVAHSEAEPAAHNQALTQPAKLQTNTDLDFKSQPKHEIDLWNVKLKQRKK